MSDDEKLEFLADIMDLDESELQMDDELYDIEEWDSLSSLMLTVEMKKRWRINLTTEKLKEFKTVRDICDYIPGE